MGVFISIFGAAQIFSYPMLIALALVAKGKAFYYLNGFAISWFVCCIMQMLYVTDKGYSIKPWMAGALSVEDTWFGTWGNPSEVTFFCGAGLVVVVGDLGALAMEKGKGVMKWVAIGVLALVSLIYTILMFQGGYHAGLHYHNQALFGLTLGLGLGLILHGVAREPLTKAGDEGKGRGVLAALVASVVMFLVIVIVYAIASSDEDNENYRNAVSILMGKYAAKFDEGVGPVEYLFADNLAYGALVIAPAGAALGLIIGDKIGKNDGKGKSSLAPLWAIIRLAILVVIVLPFSFWMDWGRWIADRWTRTFLGILLPELLICLVVFGLYIPLMKVIKLVE